MNATPAEYGVWLLCLMAFITLLSKLKGLEGNITESIVAKIMARQAHDKASGVPQPFMISEERRYLEVKTYEENRKADRSAHAALDAEVSLLVKQSAAQRENQKINGTRLATIEGLVRSLPAEIIATITNSEHLAQLRNRA